MNNEETKIPEASTEEIAAAPVTPEASEAPAESGAASAASPVRAPIAHPHKYFLLSNIFRTITVLLLIVCAVLTLYAPMFAVKTSDDDAVTFSVMDIIKDLGDEFKLCFTLDPLEDPEDAIEWAKIYEDPGDFTQAIDATICNLQLGNNDAPLKDMVESFEDTRALILLPYFLLLMPVIFVIGLAISALIRVIQLIIDWITPSPQIRKTDAGSTIVVTVFVALCYLAHFFFSCFTLNFVAFGLLLAVTIGAVVMNFVYKKHTRDIVNAQFGL